MRKRFWRKAVSLALTTAMVGVALGGCGSSDSEASGSSTDAVVSGSSASAADGETLTVDVYDDQANYQGIQTGWFAKIIKDKFNIELNIIAPNVAGGGDTLFQTRSANGDLGDLILTKADDSRLKDLVAADLVMDISPYLDGEENLQKYMTAIEDVSSLAEADGIYAVPSEISNQSATEPCEAQEPTNAASLRWDLYQQIGSPDIATMEDLIPVLQKMQEAAGTSDSGAQAYAISLFKDWDGDLMQNAQALCALYGYLPSGFALFKYDDKDDIQSAIDSDSIYVRALKFLFDANQAGIVDPESTTQNYDTLASKYTDGQILYSLWPWFGAGQYNTSEHTAEGKGFESVVIDDMNCLSYGSFPEGKSDFCIMVGSKAENPQRLVDFIDWLYSPEGIEANCASSGTTCGPEGLTWEMGDDGEPVLTDFGVKAFVDGDTDLTVPDEWGGGTWADGVSALNFKPVGLVDTNPDANNMCYNYMRWDDYIERTTTKLSQSWSDACDGASTSIEYFEDTDHLCVLPGTNYATPEYSTDIETIKGQCKSTIVEYSWKMIFAADENEFNSLLKEMQDTVTGLGYDQVFEVDKQNALDQLTAAEESAASAGSTASAEESVSGDSSSAVAASSVVSESEAS